MPKSLPVPILALRGQSVLIDADLAKLYEVSTGALNQAVRRNRARFPDEFCFQLDDQEFANLKSQNVISSSHGGRRTAPYAFTEHGALMVANVLNSPEAVKMSVFIIRAFIKQREALASNAAILKRLAEIDKSLLLHDSALRDLYQKLLPLLSPPKDQTHPRPIGFGPHEA